MGHLQDHMHSYYHQLDEDGVLDDEQLFRDEQRAQWLLDNMYYDEVTAQFILDNAYYDDARAQFVEDNDYYFKAIQSFANAATYYSRSEVNMLSAEEMHRWLQAFVQTTLNTNVTLGYASQITDVAAVASLGSTNYGFQSHATLPVAVYDITAESADARNLTLQIFLGGTHSGGAAMTQRPMNLANPQADPQAVANDNVTIDVAGTLVYTETVSAPGQGGPIEFAAGGVIIPANTVWYVTITNDGNALVTLTNNFFTGAIPLDLSENFQFDAVPKQIILTDPDTQALQTTITVNGIPAVGETIGAVSTDTAIATVAPVSDVTDAGGVVDFVVTSVAPGLCYIILDLTSQEEGILKLFIPVEIN